MSRVLVSDCIFFVSEVKAISRHELVSKSKERRVSAARALVIWLARRHTDASFQQLATRLNFADVSTPHSALQRFTDRAASDLAFASELAALEDRFISWSHSIADTRALAWAAGVKLSSPKSSSNAIEALQ